MLQVKVACLFYATEMRNPNDSTIKLNEKGLLFKKKIEGSSFGKY